MLNTEDIDSWNTLFPDCQIKQSDLTHPSEMFLSKVLVSYLRYFSYKVEPIQSMDKENNREVRLALIKLASQIDRIYKITDKSYNFCYYDLLKPTPKKTAHLLGILLNYLFYYNLYKEDVSKIIGNRENRLHELKHCIQEQETENKCKAEEMVQLQITVEKLSEELPVARNKKIELIEKKDVQEEQIYKLNDVCKMLEEKIESLQEQKCDLRKKIVSDLEATQLTKQLAELKAQIEEYKVKKSKDFANLNEYKDNINAIQKLATDVEQSRDIVPMDMIQQIQDNRKLLKSIMKEKHQSEERVSRLKQEIDDENLKLNSLSSEVINKREQLKAEKIATLLAIDDMQKYLYVLNNKKLQLEQQMQAVESEKDEQKEIAKIIEDRIQEIMRH